MAFFWLINGGLLIANCDDPPSRGLQYSKIFLSNQPRMDLEKFNHCGSHHFGVSEKLMATVTLTRHDVLLERCSYVVANSVIPMFLQQSWETTLIFLGPMTSTSIDYGRKRNLRGSPRNICRIP